MHMSSDNDSIKGVLIARRSHSIGVGAGAGAGVGAGDGGGIVILFFINILF
jgi:hypothetical protein